jgi:hypothetical protein
MASAVKLFARTLLPTAQARAIVFNHHLPEHPTARTGRQVLKSYRKGPTLIRYYPQHLREHIPEWRSEGEQYWAAKLAYKKLRGIPITKKGMGKKAMKKKKK